MDVLLHNTHWLLETDPAEHVLWLHRLAEPFTSITEIGDANLEVMQQLDGAHTGWGLVVDMRRAPARNDSEFEQAMRALREAVEARFARTALLLATQAGVLQVQRLAREDCSTTFATMSESAARAYARGLLTEQYPRMSSRPAPSSRNSMPPSRGGAPSSRGGMTR